MSNRTIPTPEQLELGLSIVKEIPLTRGKVAIVDAADYAALSQFRWHYNGHYAVRHPRVNKVLRNLFMHQAILNPPPGIYVDHINGNTLDNRRSNLRLATKAQNAHNAKRRKDSRMSFKGVIRKKTYYGARIQIDGKQRHLGYFTTIEAAARAYDLAAVYYYGEFARLNFPNEPLWNEQRLTQSKLQGDDKTSSFRGVSWFKNYQKWCAKIGADGRKHFLGYFENEVDAARAYNEAAIRLHGDNAKVNAL